MRIALRINDDVKHEMGKMPGRANNTLKMQQNTEMETKAPTTTTKSLANIFNSLELMFFSDCYVSALSFHSRSQPHIRLCIIGIFDGIAFFIYRFLFPAFFLIHISYFVGSACFCAFPCTKWARNDDAENIRAPYAIRIFIYKRAPRVSRSNNNRKKSLPI